MPELRLHYRTLGSPVRDSRGRVTNGVALLHATGGNGSQFLQPRFPQYDYDDMVAAQYELLTKGLGIDHLRLLLGTSMGCMHSWAWAVAHPDYMDAVMALACLPVQIAGRNQMWREMAIEGIRRDPEWKHGDYTTQPQAALQLWSDVTAIAFSAPLPFQVAAPTRAAAN